MLAFCAAGVFCWCCFGAGTVLVMALFVAGVFLWCCVVVLVVVALALLLLVFSARLCNCVCVFL